MGNVALGGVVKRLSAGLLRNVWRGVTNSYDIRKASEAQNTLIRHCGAVLVIKLYQIQ